MSLPDLIDELDHWRRQTYWINSIYKYDDIDDVPGYDPQRPRYQNDLFEWELELIHIATAIKQWAIEVDTWDELRDERSEYELAIEEVNATREYLAAKQAEIDTSPDKRIVKLRRLLNELKEKKSEGEKQHKELEAQAADIETQKSKAMSEINKERAKNEQKHAQNERAHARKLRELEQFRDTTISMRNTYNLLLAELDTREKRIQEQEQALGIIIPDVKFGDNNKF